MLQELHVKNIALIGEADVEFGPGLNILTGETGAGKSILLGSINLALGQKMSRDLLRTGADNALVELVFRVDKEDVLRHLAALEIETEDGLLVITRKIQGNKSICRINGETVPAAKVREVSELLLDIHGQHEHQSLLYADKQLALLDAYGGKKMAALLDQTATAYDAWRALTKEIEEMQGDESARERERSLLEFEIREIDEAVLKPGEDEELETAYRRMANGRKIADAVNAAHELTGGTDGAGDHVGRAARELASVSEYDEKIGALSAALADIDSMLSDFNRESSDYLSDLAFSEEALYEAEKRLDTINHLKSKFGKSIEEVLAYREKQAERLDLLRNFEERKERIEQEVTTAERELAKSCDKLSKERKKCARDFSGKVRSNLADLNFLASDFDIAFLEGGFCRDGRDRVDFVISTNPGEPQKPLASVASGGELSRIMLAIKALMADRDDTETLLFDEIDAGISGRTAQAVSEKLSAIAKGRQVLCITHLAQIAAQADRHFEITKGVEGDATATHIYALNEEESIQELARILGGAEVTTAALENAREMRETALREKKKQESADPRQEERRSQ